MSTQFKIRVEGDSLSINEETMTTSNLTQELLDQIVLASLDGNVKYDLNGEHPLKRFFETLQNETAKGSALHNIMLKATDCSEKESNGSTIDNEILEADQEESAEEELMEDEI